MGKREGAAEPPHRRSARASRLGFMRGQGRVPDDFKRLGAEEIEVLFGAEPDRTGR